MGVVWDEFRFLGGFGIDLVEGGETDEVLGTDLVEFSDGVVLKELSEVGLNELEVMEVTGKGFVVLFIDFKVLQSKVVFAQVRARIKGSFNFQCLRERVV